MARVGSNLPAGNMIPEVWSKKINAKFYANSVCKNITNSTWEGEIKSMGSKVIIRNRPTVVTGDYTLYQDIAWQNLDDSKVELLIDKGRYAAFEMDDVDAAQADIPVLNEATLDMAEQFKIDIDKEMLGSVYTSATTTRASQQVTKTNVLDWFIDNGVALDDLHIPKEGRWAVIPPWIAGKIQGSDLKDASLSGDSTSILRKHPDFAGKIASFEILSTTNLSGNATSSVGTPVQCLFGTKHAIAFAAQVNKVKKVDRENRFSEGVKALQVYGYKVVKADALLAAPAYK
jgi:hypothetical protein